MVAHTYMKILLCRCMLVNLKTSYANVIVLYIEGRKASNLNMFGFDLHSILLVCDFYK